MAGTIKGLPKITCSTLLIRIERNDRDRSWQLSPDRASSWDVEPETVLVAHGKAAGRAASRAVWLIVSRRAGKESARREYSYGDMLRQFFTRVRPSRCDIVLYGRADSRNGARTCLISRADRFLSLFAWDREGIMVGVKYSRRIYRRAAALCAGVKSSSSRVHREVRRGSG